MNFFTKRKERLTNIIAGLEGDRDRLRDQVATLETTNKQLKSVRKIADEDIKHMMKMKEEAMKLEQKQFEMTVQEKANNDIAAVKDNYRDKLEENLQKQIEDIKSMYKEVLARLPNISAKVKIDG